MPSDKFIGGNPVTDEDPLQVQVMTALELSAAAITSLTTALEHISATIEGPFGQAAAAASTPVVLPATQVRDAAALTDADANPIVPGVGAYAMAWDGTQMRRVKVGSTGNAAGMTGVVPAMATNGESATGSYGIYDFSGSSRLLGAAQHVWNGAAFVYRRVASVFTPLSALNTNAEITAWAATAAKKHRLMGFDLAGSIAGEYIIRDDTGGNVLYRTYLPANTPKTVDLGNGVLAAVANKPLTITGPGSSTVTGTIWGTDE